MPLSHRLDRLTKFRRKRPARPVKLHLEPMEDRTVPAQAVPVGPDLSLFGPGLNTSAKVGDSLYFLARQDSGSATAANIWHVGGTAQAQPLNVPALAGLSPVELAEVGGSLYVTAFAPPAQSNTLPPVMPSDINLWKIDPAAPGGAVKLTDFHGAGAGNLSVAGDRLVFQHTSMSLFLPGQGGSDLWATDGTVDGTRQIAEFNGATQPHLFAAQAAGDELYFPVASFLGVSQPTLWVTDGTPAGTHAVSAGGDPAPTIGGFELTSAGDAVYYGSSDVGSGSAQLWKAEGGQAALVRTFDAVPCSPIPATLSSLTADGDTLYFALNTDQGGQVWSSDGSATGTELLYKPSGGEVAPPIGDIAALDGSVYFTAVTGGTLVKIDGGSVTSVPLPGTNGLFPTLTPEGDRLYFTADDGIHGMELWSTDGSGPAVRVTDINPGSGSSYPIGPVEAGGGLYVIASDGVPDGSIPFAPQQLWKLPSAGAPAGATSSIAFTSSSPTVATGGKVTLTATVAGDGSGKPAPTGRVVFRDDDVVYGEAPLVNGAATFDATIFAPGAHSLRAVYAGDDVWDEAISTPVIVIAGQSASTVTLKSSAATVTRGQPVAFTATVTATQAVPSGTVSFLDGTTFLGMGLLTNGVATFQTNSLTAGTHSITASYNGDMSVAGSTSAALTLTVQKAATTATVKSTAATSRQGQSVTFTTTVTSPATGLPAATGSVTFKDGTKTLGTVPLSNGKAVLAVNNLAIGSHPITAAYSSDANYNASSAGMTQTVTATGVATSTTVKADQADLTAGQRLVLRAAVKPAQGTATPTGSVTFRDGTKVLGAAVLDANGETVFLVNNLGTGGHSITATFGGVGIFGGSTSAALPVTVRLPSATTVTSSASAVVSGQGVALTANVAATAGGAVQPSGSVTFYDGSTALGTANLVNGVAKFTTGPLSAVGVHRLAAKYNGNALFAGSTSGIAYINVRAAGTTTTLQPPFTPTLGTMMTTLTANVAVVAPGTGSPTGKVTFLDGSTKLGTANVTSGKATLQIPKLAAGTHYLRAVFDGTGGYGGSSSSIVRYTVAATTSTTLAAPPAAFGQTTALKATVSVLSPGFAKASGKVTFRDGSTVLGSAPLLNGVATLGAKLTTGGHSLTATFEGTGEFAASASPALSYTVTKAAPTMTLSASPSVPSATANVTIRSDAGPATNGAPKPTGKVIVRDGAVVLGIYTLTNGPIVIQAGKLTKGTHALSAAYSGDGNYLAANASLSLTVV